MVRSERGPHADGAAYAAAATRATPASGSTSSYFNLVHTATTTTAHALLPSTTAQPGPYSSYYSRRGGVVPRTTASRAPSIIMIMTDDTPRAQVPCRLGCALTRSKWAVAEVLAARFVKADFRLIQRSIKL